MKVSNPAYSYLSSFVLLLGLSACGLTQDVSLELPAYEAQPAVEAYLTPGQPFAVLLTRSSGFFDPLELDNQQYLENLLIDSAEVSIRYGNEVVILQNQVFFNPFTAQVYNYVAPRFVPQNYTDSFYLEIILPNETVIRGATKILQPVSIDSTVVEYPAPLGNMDTLARIFSYITDPDPQPGSVNRFHRILSYSPLDSTALQDFVFTDELADQPVIPIGTIFYFSPGDTVYLFNTHVDENFDKYLLSVQLAEQSNGNPFAQPSSIISNVSGSANPIGIFTGYPYQIDTVIVPPYRP